MRWESDLRGAGRGCSSGAVAAANSLASFSGDGFFLLNVRRGDDRHLLGGARGSGCGCDCITVSCTAAAAVDMGAARACLRLFTGGQRTRRLCSGGVSSD